MSLAADVPDGLAASHHAWIEAVRTTDVEAYAGLVCEDVVWLPPGEEAVTHLEQAGEFGGGKGWVGRQDESVGQLVARLGRPGDRKDPTHPRATVPHP